MAKYFCAFLILILFSCDGNQKIDTSDDHRVMSDTIVQNTTDLAVGSTDSKLDSGAIITYESATEEENIEQLEETFGKQWDFCDCIKKTDSIQKAIENAGDISDHEFENLINRFDEIDLHCKTLIGSPNKTPDERRAHEQKVKQCLQKRI